MKNVTDVNIVVVDHKENHCAHEAVIMDAVSGSILARIIYRTDDPRIWIETDHKVVTQVRWNNWQG